MKQKINTDLIKAVLDAHHQNSNAEAAEDEGEDTQATPAQREINLRMVEHYRSKHINIFDDVGRK